MTVENRVVPTSGKVAPDTTTPVSGGVMEMSNSALLVGDKGNSEGSVGAGFDEEKGTVKMEATSTAGPKPNSKGQIEIYIKEYSAKNLTTELL